MPTKGHPRITIRLEERQLAELHAIAYNQGTTAAEIGRRLILDYIASQQSGQESK